MTPATESPAPELGTPEAGSPSVDVGEVAKFNALARTWWDPTGPMKPLHKLNPARLGFIRDRLLIQAGRQPADPSPLAGLRVLDLGCGAGLVTEPLARLGATMVGVDAAGESIAAARIHAESQGLAIDYRATTAEALVAAGETFDAVLALEILEHVNQPPSFIAEAGRLVKPGGQLILSTINRTSKAYLLAIVGAEWLLRWLPRGTHDWKRFLKPAELTAWLRAERFRVAETQGLVFNPLDGAWRLSDRDLDVNYLLAAEKAV